MVTIALQILSHFPITPRFIIVELNDADWPKWLWGDKQERIKIIYPYIRDLYHGPATIREVVWIRIDNLNEENRVVLINELAQ